ncbi:MAG: hypothetical protein IPM52_01085 [Bacteroidetes bacterium]|nr:hypothetical protein [Bacteroidota bacterium]
MIEENLKKHNDFSFEMKFSFIARRRQAVSDFAVNIWFFVPNSLDINHNTYDKKDFYRDLKSNIRLITPVYLLKDMVAGNNAPIEKLSRSMQALASEPTRTHTAAYEHQIKMFLSIFKSALRNESLHVAQKAGDEANHYLLFNLTENVARILHAYRQLAPIINTPTVRPDVANYYAFGDEFLSNITEYHCFRLLRSSQDIRNNPKLRKPLLSLIDSEQAYRKAKGWPIPQKNSPDKNRQLVHRLALLKKYAENVLFLSAHKKRDGVLKEQLYYSLAAGVSMIFATAVAFSFQAKYGNLTMPFFVALVVSYMLKDRIKELGRFYFAHKLGRSYFDLKTRISLKNTRIGWSKEAMDFVEEDRTPAEVRKMRRRSPILEANNRNNNEKIILYRKLVRINRNNLNQISDYNLLGINDIVRFNLFNLTMKMDNPVVPLFVRDDKNSYDLVKGEKIYYLNIIMQLRYEGEIRYKRYRISMNRKGIRDIESFPEN